MENDPSDPVLKMISGNLLALQDLADFFFDRTEIRRVDMGYQVTVGFGKHATEKVFKNSILDNEILVIDECIQMIEKLRKAHEKNS